MLDRQLIISAPPGFHQCQRVMGTRESYRKVDEVRAPHWETRSRNQLFEISSCVQVESADRSKY